MWRKPRRAFRTKPSGRAHFKKVHPDYEAGVRRELDKVTRAKAAYTILSDAPVLRLSANDEEVESGAVGFHRASHKYVTRPISRVLYRARMASAAMTIHLGHLLPSASCDQPGRLIWKRDWRFLRRRAAPIRSCSRWGLPCHPCYQERGALLPHPFTLALCLRLRWLRRFAFCDTIPRSPPPEIIRHRASKEPGLSSLPANTLPTSKAAIRPADRGNKGLWPSRVKLA